MKKANFNTVKHFGLVHGNNGENFSIDYLNQLGFSSMAKTTKAAKLFGATVENFATGQKPVVKTLEQKNGVVVMAIGGNGVFCHVTRNNGEIFKRCAMAEKWRTIKAVVGKLLRKKNLVDSNMLQTRVCNTPF